MPKEVKILRVSPKTDSTKLSNAIIAVVSEGQSKFELRAIGADAVNQAIKGIIIAQGRLTSRNTELALRPYFGTVEGNVTSINFKITVNGAAA